MHFVVHLLLFAFWRCLPSWPRRRRDEDPTAYDFHFPGLDGDDVPLSAFRGRTVLVVNTASKCGFTPQYHELQQLWEIYRIKGLVVLGVPSGDFGNQELHTPNDIRQFCTNHYKVDFPLAAKTHVRGKKIHPFYRWARRMLGRKHAPYWNFHKYLIAPDGRLVKAYPFYIRPMSKTLIDSLEKYLPADILPETKGGA